VEISAYGCTVKFTIDTLIALIALAISGVSLGTSIRFWRRSFRPLVTAAVRTHGAGNEGITYNLVLLNSGTIPARNIRLSANNESLANAFGSGATPEQRLKWLVCFKPETEIPILHNGDRVSCSFGTTKSQEDGFWKYKATISVCIKYSGWFGLSYEERHDIKILDSDSFTGYMWTKEAA